MDKEDITILIVDDDFNARKTFGNILKLQGYTVESVATASEAISHIKDKFYHIVFIDLRLPDRSGLDVLRSIKDIHEDTMAIMVTAYASIDSSIEAMNQGAYSYIMKPINMDYLQVVLEKALEKQSLSMDNKRLLRELQEANEKLKEMDRLKSAFVAMVSHEFKNPLVVLQLSLDHVLAGYMGDINPKQEKFLRLSKNEIDRLLRLVIDLLDISKIETGGMHLKKETIEILPLIKRIITPYENLLSKKQIALQLEINQDIGSLRADEDKLSQVIINLLSNAIKYTPQQGEIRINVSRKDNGIQFIISDTGPGISQKDILKLFDKFERLIAENEEGTGLGLSIAKYIVELHKGKIWVESTVGKGSSFIFVLPA
ncbi:MAG: ATP-binding protein [bacterium]